MLQQCYTVLYRRRCFPLNRSVPYLPLDPPSINQHKSWKGNRKSRIPVCPLIVTTERKLESPPFDMNPNTKAAHNNTSPPVHSLYILRYAYFYSLEFISGLLENVTWRFLLWKERKHQTPFGGTLYFEHALVFSLGKALIATGYCITKSQQACRTIKTLKARAL